MKLRKRCLKILILIFTVTIILSNNAITYANPEGSVINDSTGAVSVVAGKNNGCPRCSWYFGGNYASGIRLALYKYEGNGKPVKCGETLDLLNTANGMEDGSLITKGYSRLEYIYGGKSVEFFNGYIWVNSTKSDIRVQKVSKYNNGNTYTLTIPEGSTAKPWGTQFIENFSKYLGTTYDEVNANIKQIFNYNNFKKEEAGKYYITVEPTLSAYSRNHNDQKVYGTAYELISILGTLNSSEYTYAEVKYDIIKDRRCSPAYNEKANEDKTICTAPGYNFLQSQANTIRNHMYNAMYVEKKDTKILEGYTDGRYDTYNFVGPTGLIHPTNTPIPYNYDKLYNRPNYHKEIMNINSPYGITVLWMRDLIPNLDIEEPPRTCKQLCEPEGTNKSNCAKEYCAANEPNNANCYNECLDIVENSPGCERETHKVCYNTDLKTNEIKVSKICSGSGKTPDEELKSKTCYDDVKTTKSYITESKGFEKKPDSNFYKEYTIYTKEVDKKLSYYKIECEETAAFRNLPSRTKVYVTPALSSTLYYGYLLDYSKICKIHYKKDHATKEWTTDYNESELKKEIDRYGDYKTIAEGAWDRQDTKQKEKEHEKKTLEDELETILDNLFSARHDEAESYNEYHQNAKPAYETFLDEKRELESDMESLAEERKVYANHLKNNKLTESEKAELESKISSIDEKIDEIDDDLKTNYSSETEKELKKAKDDAYDKWDDDQDVVEDLEQDETDKKDEIKAKEAEIKAIIAEKNRLTGVITELGEVITELGKVQNNALIQLESVKDKDVADDTPFTNELRIEETKASNSTITIQKIELTPVYCIANEPKVKEKYCDLKDKTQYTVTEYGNLTCIDSSGEEGKAKVDTTKGESTYSEKVYYSLPTSYITVNKLGTPEICHGSECLISENTVELPNAWVFEKLNKTIGVGTYNSRLTEDNMTLKVSGLGSCGQFEFELECGYKYEEDTVCRQCIEDDDEECFKKHCSCESYCGEDVACKMRYCPQECDGCTKTEKESCGGNEDECYNYIGEDKITCEKGVCRKQCNGAVGCVYKCCISECDEKKKDGHITTDKEYQTCKKICECENGGCAAGSDYVYRTISLERPFPNGDKAEGRTPGANWFEKEKYITKSNVANTKYYDSTDGRSGEYEYRLTLTSSDIKQIKQDNDLNLSYTEFKESTKATTKLEQDTQNKPKGEKADVYCSYIIHEYLSSNGIDVTSNISVNKNAKALGSGCYRK